MLSNSTLKSLQLQCTRGTGVATFCKTLHDLAINDYLQREASYYSLGLEHFKALQSIVGDQVWTTLTPSQRHPLQSARVEYTTLEHSTYKTVETGEVCNALRVPSEAIDHKILRGSAD
ncbi:hypothetical protein CYMTET_40836 [Cymbomonas tetramitiformis]|uniref:Uncharacterized protein n=1 Tax=Cymbomonas tetramitiformis TaxID=36881 RepID=A0AAE0C9B5_9CHLO|nr:hypothetical protein CYMTET_40836 [Cymbomonas tetramitiformis]